MGFSQATCIIAQCSCGHCLHHSKISFLTKESHQPSNGKYLVKRQSNFLLIILHPRHQHYLCVLCVLCSAAHSTDLYFALGCMPLSGALSSLEVTLATLEVLVMVSVPTVWAI